jgi:conjugal transfer/entry exclusion protein
VSLASSSIKANDQVALNSPNNTATTNPMNNGAQSASGKTQAYQSGGRAAALKEEYKETFGASVVSEGERKVEMATVTAAATAASVSVVFL